MSVCSASASFIPTICPGFRPCNPNGIVLGDNVTIDLCVENESIEPGAGLPPYPRVAAEIQAYSSVEVMMMCRDSSCILPQLSDTLTYHFFTAAPGVNATYTPGNSTFGILGGPKCQVPDMCGTIKMWDALALPAGGQR